MIETKPTPGDYHGMEGMGITDGALILLARYRSEIVPLVRVGIVTRLLWIWGSHYFKLNPGAHVNGKS